LPAGYGERDLVGRVRQRREARAHALELRTVDAAVLERERTRAVQPEHGDLPVDERGLEIGADVAAVLVQRARKAREHVMQRHVVVARHDDARGRERVEERARRDELRAARALGQVAGHRDDVRPDRVDRGDQRRHERGIDAAEVQVRQVHERAHR